RSHRENSARSRLTVHATMSDILWQPTPEQAASTQMAAFMREASARFGRALDDYDALWRWSVEQREESWPAVWSFCGVVASRTWDEVLLDGDKMPGATWFPGARLNFAENLLRRRDARQAIVFWNESGRVGELSFAQLYAQTARLAAALRAFG